MNASFAVSPFLCRPLQIGKRELPNRLMLAPMVGLTHIAFRKTLGQFSSPGLLSMEMCSAKSLPTERPDASPVFRWEKGEESRLVCQLVGNKPEIMAKAARRVEKEGFWGIDLNMGCSVSAVCKQGSGAALLREPRKALAIVEAVRAAVSIPVSVKFRLGWKNQPLDLSVFSRDLENAGADWLIFHPRLAPDRRSRPPLYKSFSQIKAAVSIPVFGNGNIVDVSSAQDVLAAGCDGLTIGRMAVARPWIFSQLLGESVQEENIFFRYVQSLLGNLESFFAPVRVVRLYKRMLRYVAANFVYGHQLYSALTKGESPEQLRENLHLLTPVPALRFSPDIFLFTS